MGGRGGLIFQKQVTLVTKSSDIKTFFILHVNLLLQSGVLTENWGVNNLAPHGINKLLNSFSE